MSSDVIGPTVGPPVEVAAPSGTPTDAGSTMGTGTDSDTDTAIPKTRDPATPRWLSSTEQAAWRAWLETYRLVLPVLDRQLQASGGLALSDYEVLVCLSEAPQGRLRMGSVADRTVSTRSAISRSIDRLVARGWVRRERSDEDQRGFYASLTGEGVDALVSLAPAHVATVRSTLVDLLDPDELAVLERIGRKVRGAASGADGVDAP